MTRILALSAGPAVLGILILAWAATSAREDRKPAPVRAPRPAEPRNSAPPAEPAPSFPVRAPEPGDSPERKAILERVRALDERLAELEARRDELTRENQSLERQVAEKWADGSARTTAEWRVKSWEPLLGLSEAQKAPLVDMWARWGKEDAGRPAARETWLDREAELRTRLSVEQSAKLHESAVAQAQMLWTHAARQVASVAGGSKEDQTRIRQSLGDYVPPGEMLLPEAHAADWTGFMREAAGRAKPWLTPEQTARVDRIVPK